MAKVFDCVVRNGLLVYPEKIIRANIGIFKGLIRSIDPEESMEAKMDLDAQGCYVFPGLIDPHLHPVYLDDLGAISRTAAYGGITTLVHYAYAKPGQSLLEVLRQYQKEGEEKSCLDFALHGGLFETLKQSEEIPRAVGLGVTSFKMFMAYAKLGWMTDDYAMSKAMDIIARRGAMACVHAETGLAIDYIQDRMLKEKANFTLRFQETSPDIAEAEGIFRAVSIGRLMGCPVYIPHISSREGVEVIRFLKQRSFRVFAETCPHYLGLTWSELKARGPLGKIGPSVKTREDQDALWKAVQEGLIDTIGSDHAPKDKKVKDDFFKAPYGAPGVETMLPMLWHNGVNSGRITPSQLVRMMAENPAKILGLYPQKGRLERGSDGDLVIFDPSERWTVSVSNQHSNTPYTLYEGKEILGRVVRVVAGGKLVVDRESFQGQAGAGRFLPTRAGKWQIEQP